MTQYNVQFITLLKR